MSNLFYDKEEQDSLLIPVEDEQYTVVTGTNEESVMTIDNSQQQDSILVPEATQSVILMETGTTTPKPSVPVGDYVTLDTDQTITGNKDFDGNLTFHGVTVATLDDIDLSNLVDLTSQQTISGLKIFKDQIGIINSSNGDINLIKHINNNFLITENNGTNILNIDEQLQAMYLYNKKIATEEYVNEKAMEGGSGTVVNVGGVEVSTLNFISDPQTQIDNISENLPKNVSDLTNDTGFITKNADNLANYYTKTYVDNTFYDKVEVDQRIPTALSHLTNDIGFIDNSVSDLVNYYTKVQTNNLLSGKVDKDGNKVLSTNDYTTAEKNKLASLSNYDDTDIKEDIADRYTKNETDALLLHKVDKTTLNDYYKSTDVDNLLSNKVDTTTLTTNYYNKIQTDDLLDTKASTSSVTNAITESKGYTDTKISELIGGAPETLNTLKEIADAFAEDQEVLDALETAIGNKVDKVEGKGLSSNDYTDTEKIKLASLSNYDDAAIYAEVNKKANKSELDNYYKKTETYDVVEIDGLLNSKVDKVTGKGLSTNDYTTAEKTKLNGIEEGAEKNKVNSVNGKIGDVTLDALPTPNKLTIRVTNNTPVFFDGSEAEEINIDIPDIDPLANAINTQNDIIADLELDIRANAAAISKKQENISDLDTIRSGASAGATAVQPSTLDSYYNKTQADNLLNNKVDKVTGKGLSTNDYTTAEKNKLAGLSNYDDTAIKNSIAGKVDKTTTINSKPLSSNITLNASDVGALPNTTKYGASLSLTMNTSTYVVTAQLKDQAGNNLGTAQTIDLPLESVVVSGSYDATNKKVILTLKDGSTIDFSVADLVSGLVSDTRKVAGIDLKDDITTIELSTALNLSQYANKVTSVNGKTGTVSLGAGDVGALPNTTVIPKLYDEMGENVDGAVTQKAFYEIIIALGDEFGGVISELNTTKANQSDLDTTNANVSANTTAIGNKLDKVENSTTPQVYGVDALGSQTMYECDNAVRNGGLVSRWGEQILVPEIPTRNQSATSKYYVDKVDGEIYSHINSEIERVEGLIANAGGTVVTVGSTPVTSLKFDSNPQTQITNLETSLYNTKVILESNVSTNASDIDKLETSVTNLQNNKADKAEIPTDYVKYDEDTAVDTNVINPQYANKVSGATANNLASLDANGNLLDSGISKSNVALKSNIPDVSKFITSGSLTSSSATNVKSWGVKLSSGLIFNWGYVTPANSGTPVTFPVPFTTTNYSIGATNYTVNTSQIRALAVYTYNTASFVCKGQWSQSNSGITTGDVTFRWVAIGY